MPDVRLVRMSIFGRWLVNNFLIVAASLPARKNRLQRPLPAQANLLAQRNLPAKNLSNLILWTIKKPLLIRQRFFVYRVLF
jgi:hypothetical protein